MSPPSLSASFADTKPHYPLLDGLRGVAALLVVFYHIGEAFATDRFTQAVNHGYLAVDFFFLLSGFVLGYAYDDRWGRMTVKDFFLRRLIRLQPMVVFGALFGALLFYTQGCSAWDVSVVSVGTLLLATLLNALMLPATASTDVRGWGELYPLNGPTWSLFFEYLGNIFYALVLRRLSQRALLTFVLLSAASLTTAGILSTEGNLGFGWAMNGEQFLGGSLRILFGLGAGLFLARAKARLFIPRPFLVGSLLLAVLVALPRFGGEAHFWLNGLYDSLVVVLLFPLIVLANVREGSSLSPRLQRLCAWLGDLSYPLYLVHYPLLYCYFAWVKNGELTFWQSLPGALGLVFGSLLLAVLALRFYDAPIRSWLTKRLLKR